MAIPPNITSELASLEAQVLAAKPLANASFATIKAIQLNAGNLVADIQTALTQANSLDTWIAPVDAPSIIAGFNGVLTSGNDQATLSFMRGVVGRAASNLDQQ